MSTKSPFSLIDSLNEKSYSASIVATYNAYLPFYEQVVLRRLLAAGCSYNIVLMDAAQCAASLSRDELRPRLAGTDYMLVPVSVPGAFHPKVFLRLGRRKGSLFIGSHNLTVAGFGFNDELTNLFIHDGDAAADSHPFKTVVAFLREHLVEDLPQLRQAFDDAIQVAPWLRSPAAVNPAVRILCMQAGQPDLWSQLRTIVRGRVRRAFVTAPFFDSDLLFVSRLIDVLKPAELLLAIDPDCVEIPAMKASRLQNVRWLDLSKRMPGPDTRAGLLPYLHAKAYWFETDEAEILITGSANPSRPAFTAPDTQRNAELVVARIEKPGRSLGNEIGITALTQLPEVTASVWDQIAERQKRMKLTGDRGNASCSIAVVTNSGFILDRPVDRNARIAALDINGRSLESVSIARAIPKAELAASDHCRNSAHLLTISADDVEIIAIVHHPSRIAELFASDIRRALRQTLGSIDDDPAQLESLLKLAEKVIFDSEFDISAVTQLAKKGHAGQKAAPSAGSPESLSIEAKGRRRSAHRRISLANGDITVLLDALIRRLGEGLIEPHVFSGPTEEERIDSDDDAEELPPPPVDFERLGSICRRKVRRLLKRMDGQLELQKNEPRRAIVQLAAVMSVLHRLRIIEQSDDWRRANVVLLNLDDLTYFFEAASDAVGCGRQSLAAKSLEDTDNEIFDELSIAIGLLVWLAWECEPQPAEDPEKPWTKGAVDEEEFLPWKQHLLYLGRHIVDDDQAQLIAADALSKIYRREADQQVWLKNTIAESGWIANFERNPSGGKASKNPIKPGDIVLLPGEFDPRVRLAIGIESGTMGQIVSVIDGEKEDGVRKFVASFIKNIDREFTGESSGVA